MVEYLQIRLLREDQLYKVHYRTDPASPEWENRYSSTISLTSALDRDGCQRYAPDNLLLETKHGTQFAGGWVVPRATLEGFGKTRPYRDTIPRPSSL